MKRPNILLIVLDSARADRISCYGYEKPTTPNLDRLAAEGLLFRAAYSESSWTLPVCFTLATGLAPREHLGEQHRTLPEAMPTIQQALKNRGYATFAGSANTFFGQRCGLHRGFDQFFVSRRVVSVTRPFVKYIAQRFGWTDEGGQTVTTRFLRWVGEAPEPWFALLWYNDVHHPYVAKAPFTTRFCRHPLPLRKRLSLLRRMRRMLDLAATASEADLIHISGLYDGGIAYDDMLVGRLREGLEARKLWDRTIVIVTADHGDMLGERGLMGHGRAADMYEPLVHVPLILCAPRLRSSPGESYALVQLADITHTIASLVNGTDMLAATAAETVNLLEVPSDNGRSHALSEREPFGERSKRAAQRKNPHFDFEPHQCHMTAVVEGQWKLIHRSDGRHELYHLGDDPHETRNLADAQPQRVAQLTVRVSEWQARAKPHPSTHDLSPATDPIVEKRLQDLGYY